LNENGRRTVLALHDGADLLDNPVINAIEQRVMIFTSAGAAVGAVVEFLLGLLIRRRRSRVPA
jgi:hypothetical protein